MIIGFILIFAGKMWEKSGSVPMMTMILYIEPFILFLFIILFVIPALTFIEQLLIMIIHRHQSSNIQISFKLSFSNIFSLSLSHLWDFGIVRFKGFELKFPFDISFFLF